MTIDLATPRLDLEALRADHVELLVEPLLDGRIWRFLPAQQPANGDAVRTLLEHWLAGPSAEMREMLTFENWVGYERATRFVAGAFQATIMQDGSAMIGYIVLPECQRQGYAREAMTAVCAHLREVHAVRRIAADMDRRNAASIAVARALGMREILPESPADRAFELRY